MCGYRGATGRGFMIFLTVATSLLDNRATLRLFSAVADLTEPHQASVNGRHHGCSCRDDDPVLAGFDYVS